MTRRALKGVYYLLCSVGLMFSMFSRCTKDKSPPIVCYWRVLCGRGLQTLFSFLSLSLFFFFCSFLIERRWGRSCCLLDGRERRVEWRGGLEVEICVYACICLYTYMVHVHVRACRLHVHTFKRRFMDCVGVKGGIFCVLL